MRWGKGIMEYFKIKRGLDWNVKRPRGSLMSYLIAR